MTIQSFVLNDLTTYLSRGVAPAYDDEGILVLNQRCIRNNRVDLEPARITNPEKRRVAPEKRIRKWDVLVNSTGVGTLGRVAQVTDDLGEATVDSHVTIVRPDLDRVDGRYFGYALIYRQPQIEMMGEGATGQTELSRTRLGDEIEIPLPPLETQRQIADILSAYDDLIENNTRRIQILEEMARTIYREWFVHFRYPGHESVPLVDSPIGPVPEGWEVEELGNLAEENRRTIKPEEFEPDWPYVGLEHIPRRSIALSDWGIANEVNSSKLAFRRGEILFSKIRPYFHKVAVAPVDGICSTDAIVISAKSDEYYPLILACVSSDEFVAHATQTSQGTKMPRANWKVLTKYLVPIPPPDLLTRFNELMTDLVRVIQTLVFRSRNLSATRDLLLPRLVSGGLAV